MRAFFLLFALAFGSLAAAEDVRLTNGEWAPYLGATLPHQGVASRIVAEAFALEGVTVHWEFYPGPAPCAWPRKASATAPPSGCARPTASGISTSVIR